MIATILGALSRVPRWVWIALIALFLLFLLIISLGRVNLFHALAPEIAAIKAEARAEKLTAELGHERAINAIEDAHKDAITKFDNVQRAQAAELRSDPKKLAAYLARVGAQQERILQ